VGSDAEEDAAEEAGEEEGGDEAGENAEGGELQGPGEPLRRSAVVPTAPSNKKSAPARAWSAPASV